MMELRTVIPTKADSGARLVHLWVVQRSVHLSLQYKAASVSVHSWLFLSIKEMEEHLTLKDRRPKNKPNS